MSEIEIITDGGRLRQLRYQANSERKCKRCPRRSDTALAGQLRDMSINIANDQPAT
jgi:hypothetical protein